jgi:glycerol 2-dehydrogenase (NADP+)
MAETWKQMEQLVGDECRAIGVSNFSVKNLEILLKEAKIVPAVDQVILQVEPIDMPS